MYSNRNLLCHMNSDTLAYKMISAIVWPIAPPSGAYGCCTVVNPENRH